MRKVNRSAKSGKFVTKAKAKKSPNTTVTERMKKKTPVIAAKLTIDAREAVRSMKLFKQEVREVTKLVYRLAKGFNKLKHRKN